MPRKNLVLFLELPEKAVPDVAARLQFRAPVCVKIRRYLAQCKRASIRLKIAVFAPIPKPSETTATNANTGLLRRLRSP